MGLVLSVSAAAELIIHTPEQVLDRFTERVEDRLFFQSPEGDRWELITTVDDPAIRNRGDGAFFPVEEPLVRDAEEAITYPIDLDVEVFLLPYPRRGLLPSSAGSRSLYLSPGVRAVSPEKVHALVAHELGHVVHRALLPETDRDGWLQYRVLRGIEDPTIYHSRADHRNRPREIFAEDFRSLFGGVLANYGGGVENPDIQDPNRVPGLREFFLGLHDRAVAGPRAPRPGTFRAWPNPAPGRVSLAFSSDAGFHADAPYALSVFDVQGRIVSHEYRFLGSAEWDGRTLEGRTASEGLYFLRVRQNGRDWTGKVLVRR